MNWKKKLIEQKDKKIKIMKIKIEMKKKYIYWKVKLKRIINVTKGKKKKSIKNEDQIGQYNISQLGLKDVIEKI